MRNLTLLVLVLLSGCTYFTKPLDQPVIEEKLNSRLLSKGVVGTLSLTPERRVVLVNFNSNRFCAEAPTEIGIDVNKILKVAATASKGDELEAGLNAVAASARNNTVLNRRTQGMQLYLASSYFICQMYMNEAISNRDAVELNLRTLKSVEPLIMHEIQLMYDNDAFDPPEFEASDVINVPETLEGLEFSSDGSTNE